MHRYKKGFTFAEILITLLVIGVVASLVIPEIIQDTQNAELKVSWKKAVSSASQAYSLAVIENGNIGFGDYGLTSTHLKWNKLKEKLNVIKSCEGNNKGNCWALNGVSPDSSVQSVNCGGFKLSNQNTSKSFVTSDGMFWLSYPNIDAVAVDVNGEKGPNEWGKDVHEFGIGNNKIIPFCCDSTCNSVKFLKQ